MKDDKVIAPLSYSPDDAARRLGVGRSKVFELINSGELAISKLGSRTLVHEKSLQDLLQKNMVSKTRSA